MATLTAVTFVRSKIAEEIRTRSAQLQVLERVTGTWNSVVTNRQTGENFKSAEKRH